MKRLIKYWNTYDNYKHFFSNCSTNYELLPIIVDDDAKNKELLEYALRLDYETKGNPLRCKKKGYNKNAIKNSIQLKEVIKEKESFWSDKTKSINVYLGFINIPSGCLEIKDTLKNEMSQDDSYNVVNNQEYGVANVGEHVDGYTVLVKQSWEYYHAIELAGYSIEHFESLYNIKETGFDDDTYMCDGCNKYDDRDDGCAHNHRIIDCELLGINCGCYADYMESNFDYYINKDNEALELSVAEKLQEQGKLKHVERFIGGMVDGRGGYYGGESCNEGTPKNILKELLGKNENGQYLFTHDESGQFQMYFSVWEVVA